VLVLPANLGRVLVARNCPIGLAIDELEVTLLCSEPGEFTNRIVYIPDR
jgi:hypothetical protein